MKYRQNYDTPAPNPKKDPIGKQLDAYSLNVAKFESESRCVFADRNKCRIDRSHKFPPETASSRLIPGRCLIVLKASGAPNFAFSTNEDGTAWTPLLLPTT
jgi:hypothetical protein